MTWYLTIRSDASYSRTVATDSIVQFLSELPELEQIDGNTFQSVSTPWVLVLMAQCDAEGNYSSDGQLCPEINVIELACSISGDAEWYEALACRIAQHVGWEVIHDE